MGGAAYGVVEKHIGGKNVRDLAENFVLYGALAEIYAKKNGFNAGLGGSMHTFFKPFGSMPNNAIVGGSATIAVRAALYKKINHKGGIVIANIGDGALARGPVYEGSSSPRWTSTRRCGMTIPGIPLHAQLLQQPLCDGWPARR